MTFANRLRLRRRVDEIAAAAPAPARPLLAQAVAEVQSLPDHLHRAAAQLAADCAAGSFDAAGFEAVLRLRTLALFMTECEETARDLLALVRLAATAPTAAGDAP